MDRMGKVGRQAETAHVLFDLLKRSILSLAV